MSNQLGKEFWTYQLNSDEIVITSDFGLTAISIVLVSGDGTVTGSLVCDGLASMNLFLTIGQPLLISTDALNFVNNIRIKTDGVINLVGR